MSMSKADIAAMAALKERVAALEERVAGIEDAATAPAKPRSESNGKAVETRAGR